MKTQPETLGQILENLEASIEALERWNENRPEPEFRAAILLLQSGQLWLEKYANKP